MTWFLAHLIGDYILQNDWMAAGKKQKSWICVVHVFFYMFPFFIVSHIVIRSSPLLTLSYWQFMAIAIQHFIQDRTGLVVWFMKKKGQANFAQPPMAPWSIIVTDNIIHMVWIAIIIKIGMV